MQKVTYKPGDRVNWVAGSRLAGLRGVIAESGYEWSFVNVDGSDQQEYTPTALLEPVKDKE